MQLPVELSLFEIRNAAISSRNRKNVFFVADNQAGTDTKLTVEDLFKPEFKVHDPEAKWVNVNRSDHSVSDLQTKSNIKQVMKNIPTEMHRSGKCESGPQQTEMTWNNSELPRSARPSKICFEAQ
ncbi:Dipeptidyl aminopeptidase-like protein 6 Dipeptidyl peptidase 6 Dipeptidyl peptidase VI [Channa argus]|uniref:Dipeptidyl aminopeptidase-like protein 6 Dipeptidyl peptidase 6 Dipeptidyl peptidase VI n=1 Tax=Channa argus TaxID=215402 RepID=A0A6G1PXV6_CHAAH|nr:Dipeptidyl aminopeptidase-like protein 6 Dipeptidyl peptidase 6 Dipeptidyl peptidase VI [Channa argus]